MPSYNEKTTILKQVTVGFRNEPDLPVIPLKMQVERAASPAPHAHLRGQLVYASVGIVRVVTSEGTWLSPSTQAVWIPPDVQHETYFQSKVTLYSLFVSAAESARFPQKCRVLQVSNLLREMIFRSLAWGDQYQPGDDGFRFMQVLLDEILRAEPTDIHLPSAKDPRLIKVTNRLIEQINPMPNTADLAALACVSARTLARLFAKETGLTLGDWNRRLLVQIALDELNKGASVQTVTANLGYKNPSAFIDMFKSVVGASPMKYIRGATS